MKENITPELLKRYFDNTCSAEEREIVQRWLDPQESWNLVSAKPENHNKREEIWSAISAQIEPRIPRESKIIPMFRYAAACAAVVLASYFWFSSTNKTLSDSLKAEDSLVFNEINFQTKPKDDTQIQAVFNVENPTHQTASIIVTSNGREVRMPSKSKYLTIFLKDPGVLGDQVLILSPEQIKMLPDVALAPQLAAIVSNQYVKSQGDILL